MPTDRRMIGWIDASGGVAGDMLLGALVDAGADLVRVQQAVDAVMPDSARLRVREVSRAGVRALKLDVDVLVDDPPHRHWSDIRDRIVLAELTEPVRERVLAVFTRLAEAEARVHGVPVDDIHFHEVGAVDSIADIVGTCAAVDDLGITDLVGGPAAVGSGRIRVAHGDMGVPGPATAELLRDWPIRAGGPGELTTPTGAALLTGLSATSGELPPMVLRRTGVGAGTRDDHDRANVTRVLIGERADVGPAAPVAGVPAAPMREVVLLEANIDDLDPRVWPSVLAALLRAGAADAWLVPAAMKKGRPGQVLSVLADPADADALRGAMLAHTTTFGVRQTAARQFRAARGWADASLGDAAVPVKIAHAEGRILRATPEFDDVAALAEDRDEPVVTTMDRVRAAAAAAGMVPGAPIPAGLRPVPRSAAGDPDASGSSQRPGGDAP